MKVFLYKLLISLVALVDVETNDLLFLNEDPSVKKLADNAANI